MSIPTTEQQPNPATTAADDPIQGRSAFQVQTTAAGIMISTIFMTNDGQVLQLPAVFPTLEYGLAQIDELRRHVLSHFEQAAQIGAQVIAANAAASEATTADSTDTALVEGHATGSNATH